MKKIFFLLLAAVVGTGVIPAGNAAGAEKEAVSKVIAYYFHGSARCPTCHKLQRYSQEAIEANFKDALTSGKLEFKAVNVEEKDNQHFVKDYQLYTKSLVLVLIRDGKEIKFENLVKIWDYAGNKQKFFEYVASRVSGFLKGQ